MLSKIKILQHSSKDGDPMKYTALYRQWRPTTFEEMVGQDHVVRILKNQIAADRISHAYLFSGSRGTGKTTTAKIFAQAVNCLQPDDGSPCGECQVCHNLSSGNNMDVIEIDAASNNGVEEIRELRDKVKYPPGAGRYKVYIIDEVHMLSTAAFNAFLKTLEEPPEHVVFILATTEPHKLPSTILSRCQRYDFKRVPLRAMMNRLGSICTQMDIQVEKEALETIARWAEGSMRDAISLLDQCIGFCGALITNDAVLGILGTADRGFLFQVVHNLMEGNVSSILKQIDQLVEEGKDIPVLLKDLIYHLRNVMMAKISDDPSKLLDVSESTLEQYKEQALKTDESRIIRAIEILSNLEADLKWNAQPRVMLEMAMIKVCRPQTEDSLEAILDRIKVLEKQISEGITKPIMTITDKEKPAKIDDTKTIEQDNMDIQKISSPPSQEKILPEKPKKIVGKDKEKHSTEKDIHKAWPEISKLIKKERLAIYSLLGDAKLSVTNKGVVTLIFPSHQGFYAAAIEKENNREYIENLIAQFTEQEVKLRCCMEDEMDPIIPDEPPNAPDEIEEEQAIFKKAVEIFGEEYVEVVE